MSITRAMQAKSAIGLWFLVIFRAFEMEKNYEMKQKEILKIYALFSFFFFHNVSHCRKSYLQTADGPLSRPKSL